MEDAERLTTEIDAQHAVTARHTTAGAAAKQQVRQRTAHIESEKRGRHASQGAACNVVALTLMIRGGLGAMH
jgi:hypothetical protein